MNLRHFFCKLICFFVGHDIYRIRWSNDYRCCRNRKGGKKRGRGVWVYRVKHHEDRCRRCGKVVKKK